MKPFEQQRSYNPQQYDVGGAPLQAPDIASQIEQEYERGKRRDKLFFDSISANQRQQLENLNTEANNENQQLALEAKQLQQLGAFADKVFNKGVQVAKVLDSKAQARGKAKRLDMSPDSFSPEAQAEYERLKAQLEAEDKWSTQKAAEVLRQTQDFEIARRWKTLGGAERIGFAKEHLTQAKIQWPSYLQDQLLTSTDEVTLPDGTTFQVKDARGSAMRAAASSVVYEKFVTQQGLEGTKTEFLEDYFNGGKDGARINTQKQIASLTKLDNLNDSQDQFTRDINNVRADLAAGKPMDINQVYAATGTLLGGKSGDRPLTNTERWEKTKGVLEDMIDSRQIEDELDLQAIFDSSIDPVTGKPMSEARFGLLADLRQHMSTVRQQQYTSVQQGGKRQWSSIEQQAYAQAEAQGGDFSFGELQAIQKRLDTIQGGGGRSERLDRLYRANNEQVQNLTENKKLIEEAIENGTATEQMLRDAGLYQDADLRSRVQAVNKMNTGKGKEQLQNVRSSIQSQINTLVGITTPDAPGNLYTLPVVNFMEADVRKRVVLLQRQNPDMPLDEAISVAAKESREYFEAQGFVASGTLKDGKAVTGVFSPGTDGKFANFYASKKHGGKFGQIMQTAERAATKFNDDFTTYGTGGLETKDAYISKEGLEADAKGYLNADGSINQNYRKNFYVQALADAMPNMDYFQVLNKLRLTNELPELPVPPSLNFQDATPDSTIDPDFAKLLDKARNGNPTLRAGFNNPTGTYTEQRVPEPLRPVLKKVTEQTGFRPELVTAIAQEASGLQPEFQSPVQADGSTGRGLFAVNTAQNPEYKFQKNNVEANAEVATAKLLKAKELTAAAGVAPKYAERYALAMYHRNNTGVIPVSPSGVPDFSATDLNYISSVMKQMGGLGVRTVLYDSSTQRQTFARVTEQGDMAGRFRNAVVGQESGGNPNAVNSRTGAAGLGQVMPENVGPWTEKHLGRRMTYEEFLADPQAQERVIMGEFQEVLGKHNQPGRSEEEIVRRAAAEWYGGPGGVKH